MEPVFEVRGVGDHVDDDARVAGRGATALAEIAAKRLPDLRVRVRAAGNDGNSGFVEIEGAELEVVWQRVNRNQLQPCCRGPGAGDVTELGCARRQNRR